MITICYVLTLIFAFEIQYCLGATNASDNVEDGFWCVNGRLVLYITQGHLSGYSLLWKIYYICSVIISDFLSMFTHNDFGHLISNIIVIILCSTIIEYKIGSQSLLLVLCLMIIINVIGVTIYQYMLDNQGISWVSRGADGVCYSLVCFVPYCFLNDKVMWSFACFALLCIGRELNSLQLELRGKISSEKAHHTYVIGGFVGVLLGAILVSNGII